MICVGSGVGGSPEVADPELVEVVRKEFPGAEVAWVHDFLCRDYSNFDVVGIFYECRGGHTTWDTESGEEFAILFMRWCNHPPATGYIAESVNWLVDHHTTSFKGFYAVTPTEDGYSSIEKVEPKFTTAQFQI